MRLSKILFCLSLAGSASAQGMFLQGPHAHYWNDSVGGSDSNNGLDPTKPLQTIAAMSAKPIPRGTTFHLAYNSQWREQFTSPVANLSFIGYGTGTLPLIDGSDVLANGSFTKTGGLTNVYQIAVTVPASGIDCINIFEAGAYLTYKSSQALVDSNAGTYTVSSCSTAGAQTLFVHATSGDPTTNGLLYEYTARAESLNGSVYTGSMKATGWTISNVWTRRNADPTGSISFGRRGRVLNSLIDQGNRHSFLCGDGCDLEGTTIQYGSDFNQGAILCAVNEDVPISLGITISNSTFHTGAIAGNAGSSACISHNGSSGNFGAAVVSGVLVDGNGAGISLGNITSQSFTGMTGLPPGLAGGAASSSFSNSTTSGAALLISTGSQAVTINNVTHTSPTSAISVTAANVNLTVTNSNLTSAASQAQILTNGSSTGFVLTRTGDTFSATSGSYLRDSLQGDSVISNSDFNTWNGTMSGGSYYTYTYNTGWEFHSTPQLNYVFSARWNLGSSHVSGSTIPDIDGQGLNLNFPGGGHNPTSQTAGCLFGSSLYLSGPALTAFKALTPAAQITYVFQWTGTVGGLSTQTLMGNLNHGGFIEGGVTASKAKGIVGQFGEGSPTSSTSIDDGNWHAATMMTNGTSNAPIHLWIDGVEQGSVGTMTGNYTNGVSDLVWVGANVGGTTLNWTGVIGYVEYGAGFMSAPAYATYYAGLKSSLAAQGITLP